MHKARSIEFDASWLTGDGLPRAHGIVLTRLLDALSRAASLGDAARAIGISYRFAWGLLGEGAQILGAPLVDMGRGRGAKLTPIGRRVLEADARVRAALAAPFEHLRNEVREILAETLPGRPRLSLRASHDLALGELARICTSRLDLEIEFQGADDSLAALARGQCDLAGFHVADALPRAAAAAAALGRWLDPKKHHLVHFVAREQGLIVRHGSRIRSVHDLARPRVRFINRSPGRVGESERANADLLVAEEVAEGRADAGFGLRAAAARYGLDFVPLATERYFLAASRVTLRGAGFQALRHALRSAEFAESVAALPGYDASEAGASESIAAALSWLGHARNRL